MPAAAAFCSQERWTTKKEKASSVYRPFFFPPICGHFTSCYPGGYGDIGEIWPKRKNPFPDIDTERPQNLVVWDDRNYNSVLALLQAFRFLGIESSIEYCRYHQPVNYVLETGKNKRTLRTNGNMNLTVEGNIIQRHILFCASIVHFVWHKNSLILPPLQRFKIAYVYFPPPFQAKTLKWHESVNLCWLFLPSPVFIFIFFFCFTNDSRRGPFLFYLSSRF